MWSRERPGIRTGEKGMGKVLGAALVKKICERLFMLLQLEKKILGGVPGG